MLESSKESPYLSNLCRVTNKPHQINQHKVIDCLDFPTRNGKQNSFQMQDTQSLTWLTYKSPAFLLCFRLYFLASLIFLRPCHRRRHLVTSFPILPKKKTTPSKPSKKTSSPPLTYPLQEPLMNLFFSSFTPPHHPQVHTTQRQPPPPQSSPRPHPPPPPPPPPHTRPPPPVPNPQPNPQRGQFSHHHQQE